MDGKVCVITGGAGSVGLESARLLWQEGAKVMLVDNNKQMLTKALETLGGESDSVSSVVADVSNTQQTKRISTAASKNGARSTFCSAMRGSAV